MCNMQLPKEFQTRISNQLGADADNLIKSLEDPIPTTIRTNPFKNFRVPDSVQPIPWCEHGFYLNQRPSFILDPAFHAGMYYVQEASSMSLDFILKQLHLDGALALDLCGAPGGKSSLIASHLWKNNGLLVANEVIKSRANILKENLIKWGLPNVAVSQLDAAQITKTGLQFDLIAVDAPCSGEGMFRKDHGARTVWSENTVQLCSARQKRILADIVPALKENGYLIYSTCTFNEEENETNMEWLTNQNDFTSLRIPFPPEWNIVETSRNGLWGYRFYPHHIKGEGFFVSVLQKNESSAKPIRLKNPKINTTSGVYDEFVKEGYTNLIHQGEIYSIPKHLTDSASLVLNLLRVQYIGLKTAEQAGKDFKPHSDLAFNLACQTGFFRTIELSHLEALHFLKRDELKFPNEPVGWLKLNYQQCGLGFVKNLGNRSNSQYPKEWIINKSIPSPLDPPWHH